MRTAAGQRPRGRWIGLGLLLAAGCSREESGAPAPAVQPIIVREATPEPVKPPLAPLTERVEAEIRANPALEPAGLKVQVVAAGVGYVTLQVTAFPPGLTEALARGTSAALERAAAEGDIAAEALLKLEQALRTQPDVKAVFWQPPSAEALARGHLATAQQLLAQTQPGQTAQAAAQVARARALAPDLPAPDLQAVQTQLDRTRASQRLSAIGRALAQYHDAVGVLPPGYVAGKNRLPYSSWLTALLPFLHHEDVYNAYNTQFAYDDVANSTVMRRTVEAFLSPDTPTTRSPSGYGATHFAGVTVDRPDSRQSPLGVFGMNSSVRLSSLRDGAGRTLVAGQIAGNLPGWGEGDRTLRAVTAGINRDRYRGFASNSPGGALFLFADGSVRWLSEDIDPAVLRALATRDGGEPVGEDEF